MTKAEAEPKRRGRFVDASQISVGYPGYSPSRDAIAKATEKFGLSPEEREVVLARVITDPVARRTSFRAIGCRLGLSTEGTRQMWLRARRKVRAALRWVYGSAPYADETPYYKVRGVKVLLSDR